MSYNPVDLEARALPAQVRFASVAPLSFEASASHSKFYAINGGGFDSYSNSVIKIAINSQNSFLDGTMSYLKFDLKNISGQSARIQSSGHSIFKSIRVQSKLGGVDLEYSREHAQLICSLSDLTLGQEQRRAKQYEGYGVSYPFTSATLLGCGEKEIAIDGIQTFIVPLHNNIVGTSSEKYFPLMFCEIGLELELNPEALVHSADAGTFQYQISNLAYHAQLITFSSSVNEALNNMVLSSGLFINAVCWNSQMIPVAGGSQNVLISQKYKSVKSILWSFSLTI